MLGKFQYWKIACTLLWLFSIASAADVSEDGRIDVSYHLAGNAPNPFFLWARPSQLALNDNQKMVAADFPENSIDVTQPMPRIPTKLKWLFAALLAITALGFFLFSFIYRKNRQQLNSELEMRNTEQKRILDMGSNKMDSLKTLMDVGVESKLDNKGEKIPFLENPTSIPREFLDLESLLMRVVDSIPMGCEVRNVSTDKLFYANKQHLNLFGFNDLAEYQKNFRKSFPEYQPNGRLTTDVLRDCYDKAVALGSVSMTVEYLSLEGKPFLCECRWSRVFCNGETYLIAFNEDLRQSKYTTMLQEIRQQFDLLPCIADGDWDGLAKMICKTLANQLNYDYVAAGVLLGAFKKLGSLSYGYSVAKQKFITRHENIPFDYIWKDKMNESGMGYFFIEPIESATSLPENIRDQFLAASIVSMMQVGIFVGNVMIGFLTLASSQKRGPPTTEDINFFRNVSDLCSLCLSNYQRRLAEGENERKGFLLQGFLNAHELEAYFVNAEGQFLVANQAFLDSMHISGDVEGQLVKDIIPQKEWEKIQASDMEVIRTGKGLALEESFTNAEGITQFQEIRKVPLILEDGTIFGCGTLCFDISDRQKIEQINRDARESFNAVLMQQPTPICVFDMQTARCFFANEGFLKIVSSYVADKVRLDLAQGVLSDDASGVAQEEMVKLMKYLWGDDYQEKYDLLSVNKEYTHEHTFVDRNGEKRNVIASYKIVQYMGRRCVINTLVDISAEKKRSELLAEAKKVAEEANFMKERFLANMSHEIRTPMNSILGRAYLELQRAKDSRLRGSLQKIYDSSQILLNIVSDLLDFSNISSGQVRLEKKPFNLNDVMDQIMHMLISMYREKHLDVVFLASKSLPENLLGDRFRVWQVLKNLFDNALKFTKEGRVEFKAECIASFPETKTTPAVHQIRFTIRDTGVGMSKIQIAKSFKPFEQFSRDDHSILRHGTGIGLSVSKQLVEQMHGTMHVDSELGKGSVFKVDLCFEEIPDANMGFGGNFLQGKTVLLVEKDDVLCDNLHAVMTSWGMTCTVAKNLQSIAFTSYDILLLEYSGQSNELWDWVRIIRSENTKKKNKIIVLASNSPEWDDPSIENLQLDGVIEKPFTHKFLFSYLINILFNTLDLEHTPSVGKLPTRKNKEFKVLVAEDLILNQEILTELLGNLGLHRVTFVKNGKEALRLASENAYDLILMDIQMPEMNGLEASDAIRASKGSSAKTPIIAMTAYASEEDKKRVLEHGMNDHVSKPIEPLELERVLKNYLPDFGSENGGNDIFPARHNALVLDKEGALLRMGNNKNLFHRLIELFSSDYENFSAKIVNVPHDEALNRIHGFKGVAGNLGFMQLYNTILCTERHMKTGGTLTSEILTSLTMDLEKAINAAKEEIKK